MSDRKSYTVTALPSGGYICMPAGGTNEPDEICISQNFLTVGCWLAARFGLELPGPYREYAGATLKLIHALGGLVDAEDARRGGREEGAGAAEAEAVPGGGQGVAEAAQEGGGEARGGAGGTVGPDPTPEGL